MFNLTEFICDYVTKRESSMFLRDIERNKTVLYEKIQNRKILVIGGAGSIGSSFIKAVLQFYPSMLVIVDTNENGLAEITRDLRSTKGLYIPKAFFPYPMDFSSNVFKKMFISKDGFDVVANFSAHKHVRSEKDIYSVETLLQNNVLKAIGLLELLAEYPPEVYFCVSTDKAANPVNIMGASKRLMEDLIFSYSDKFPVKTARFANVAFSNGSLPAGFLERIQKMQPLSAPMDVKRFFVSPEESGQICMLACMLGKNREIFFPKLDERQMMTFDVIAENLLHEYGFEILRCKSDEEAIEKAEALKNGAKQYPVHFSISDTSGEKPYEEFFTDSEHIDMNRFFSLGVITDKGKPNKTKIEKLIENLSIAFKERETTKEEIIHIIKSYLPNFNHIETGRTLDEKM